MIVSEGKKIKLLAGILKKQMKFEDYSQVHMRKRYDYCSIVTECKNNLEVLESELKAKIDNIMGHPKLANPIDIISL